MIPALFKAQAFFGEVALRVIVEGEGENLNLSISPEQAKALSKALGKAARAAEKNEA